MLFNKQLSLDLSRLDFTELMLAVNLAAALSADVELKLRFL